MSSMVVAMGLSFFLTGIGQAYLSKQWVKGIAVFFGLIIISFVLNLALLFVMPLLMPIVSLLFLLVWLFGLYDTYKMAQAKEGKGTYKSPIFG
ncbi:MAG: hypothetical protein V1909_01300 [Candidatus Micrarchaeota archaeon]